MKKGLVDKLEKMMEGKTEVNYAEDTRMVNGIGIFERMELAKRGIVVIHDRMSRKPVSAMRVGFARISYEDKADER